MAAAPSTGASATGLCADGVVARRTLRLDDLATQVLRREVGVPAPPIVTDPGRFQVRLPILEKALQIPIKVLVRADIEKLDHVPSVIELVGQ